MSLASFCHLAAFGTSDVGRSSDGIIGSLSLDTDYFLDGYYADLGIQPVKLVAGRTVNVGPPLASEVFLVEHCSVGAEEVVLNCFTFRQERADVEYLATGFNVRIVTS